MARFGAAAALIQRRMQGSHIGKGGVEIQFRHIDSVLRVYRTVENAINGLRRVYANSDNANTSPLPPLRCAERGNDTETIRGIGIVPDSKGRMAYTKYCNVSEGSRKETVMNNLQKLNELGQSPWFDNISRDLL